MCGRYTLHASIEQIAGHFRLRQAPEITPRFNIAPSQAVPAIRGDSKSKDLVMLRWGLIPSWAKEEKSRYSMINARAETVTTKPAFRGAFRYRRCLIPADGFYEWKPAAGKKQPYYIRCRDGKLFSFAGLWERWQGEDGHSIESCAIIVTDANDLLRPIHDRMPVILAPSEYNTWLDPQSRATSTLTGLLQPYAAEELEAYPVSRRMNSPINDNPECIAPLS